jgi:hypothetical protein
MLEDMHIDGHEDGISNRAGILPYIALLAGVALVWYMHSL